MGRMNEDVFSCRKCGESVVYEPGGREIQNVACGKCGASHVVINIVRFVFIDEGGATV